MKHWFQNYRIVEQLDFWKENLMFHLDPFIIGFSLIVFNKDYTVFRK